MRCPCLRNLTILIAVFSPLSVAVAAPPGIALPLANEGPARLCREAILRTERAQRIPDQFLSAIGRVETGRLDPQGIRAPWPWTVDAEGQGHFYPTREAAIAAVQALQARSVRSIDVGCLQVNLQFHPDAFASLDEAFDPDANARYAARLLSALFQQTGSWPHAAAAYHSHTPALGSAYQRLVLQAWAEPPDTPAATPVSKPLSPTVPAAPPPVTSGGGASPLFAGGAASSAFLHRAAPLGMTGRSLDSYRRMPVRLALIPPKA